MCVCVCVCVCVCRFTGEGDKDRGEIPGDGAHPPQSQGTENGCVCGFTGCLAIRIATMTLSFKYSTGTRACVFTKVQEQINSMVIWPL